ncbi:hypothetical protein Hanom_Chr12g01101811 [Helianthus anomalus]
MNGEVSVCRRWWRGAYWRCCGGGGSVWWWLWWRTVEGGGERSLFAVSETGGWGHGDGLSVV